MSKQILAAIAAIGIAAGSVLATAGAADAATAKTPHYKPLICGFLPFLCPPPKHHVHHVVKKKPVHHVVKKKPAVTTTKPMTPAKTKSNKSK